MENVLTQLEAAVAELAPQLKALRTATSALNRAARLAAAEKADALPMQRALTRLEAAAENVENETLDSAGTLAGRLEMGRFHHLLPADIAVSATLDQVNLTRFGQLFRVAIIIDNAQIYQQLHSLTR